MEPPNAAGSAPRLELEPSATLFDERSCMIVFGRARPMRRAAATYRRLLLVLDRRPVSRHPLKRGGGRVRRLRRPWPWPTVGRRLVPEALLPSLAAGHGHPCSRAGREPGHHCRSPLAVAAADSIVARLPIHIRPARQCRGQRASPDHRHRRFYVLHWFHQASRPVSNDAAAGSARKRAFTRDGGFHFQFAYRCNADALDWD
jgi:hypothetical protein